MPSSIPIKMIVVSRCARMGSPSEAGSEDASFRSVRKPSSPWRGRGGRRKREGVPGLIAQRSAARRRRSATALPYHELYESIDSESGVGDDATECTLSELLAVRHDHTSIRVAAAEDHMTAGL